MASRKSKKSNKIKAVEDNGIHMKIMVPELVALAIPQNQVGAIVTVTLPVGIINNTLLPFAFKRCGGLIPELVGPDEQVMRAQEPINRQFGTERNHWILADRKRGIGVSLKTWIFWQNNSLTLAVSTDPDHWQIPASLDNLWTFDALQSGMYQMRFTYDSYCWEVLSSNPETSHLAELKEIVTDQLMTPFVNLCLLQPLEPERNAVEIDGIRFQTLLSERVLIVSEKQPKVEMSVHLGIHITNNTPNPVCFSFYSCFIPEVVAEDGQILQGSYYMDWSARSETSDFNLAMPGKSVTFFPNTGISWIKEDQFRLSIAVGDGGFWSFKPLKLGIYQIQLTYINDQAQQRVQNQETRKSQLLENIWTGMVSMPFIEFRLA